MPYYIDSSENASAAPDDAIEGPIDTIEYARERALAWAQRHPGTIFYVNETVVEVVQVFKVQATLTVESEVIASAITV